MWCHERESWARAVFFPGKNIQQVWNPWWVILPTVWSDCQVATRNRKFIDIAKTSRRLFSIRPLFTKLQLGGEFYSVFDNLIPHRKQDCHESMRPSQYHRPIGFVSLISVLHRKTNRIPIGCLRTENEGEFYSPWIKFPFFHRVWTENRSVLGIVWKIFEKNLFDYSSDIFLQDTTGGWPPVWLWSEFWPVVEFYYMGNFIQKLSKKNIKIIKMACVDL